MYSQPTPDTTFDKYDEMRLHMEQLFKASIVDIGLPMRIVYPLGDAGIRTLGDLVRKNRKWLLGVNRIGEKAVDEIIKCIERFGLNLGMK